MKTPSAAGHMVEPGERPQWQHTARHHVLMTPGKQLEMHQLSPGRAMQ